MSETTQDTAVRFEITVEAPVERAFSVFTEQFDRIKPREHNLLAPEPIAETVFETRVGGHVYDRGENGSVCRWARVLAFEPPHRFVISWDISPAWQIVTDPAEASEVEVRFVSDGPERTRVEQKRNELIVASVTVGGIVLGIVLAWTITRGVSRGITNVAGLLATDASRAITCQER